MRRIPKFPLKRFLGTTVFQLSSSPPLYRPSGVAVLRISGPQALDALLKVSNSPKRVFTPRKASLIAVYHPESLCKVDSQAIALFFPSPNSFTGEDVVELHIHGNNVVLRNTFDALKSCGLEEASAGEFTRRAFENGKLDLTQIEGLADFLHAETDLQSAQAMDQMEGHLGQLYRRWRELVIESLAQMEAVIDFGETEMDVMDQQIQLMKGIDQRLAVIRDEMEEHLKDGRRGEIVREGIKVTLFGPPNVGKSSIMNRLARRDVAIVTDIPGTTRDVIETFIEVGGVPLRVSDTAGMRETYDRIEKVGIERTLASISNADVLIGVVDANRLIRKGEGLEFDSLPSIIVVNKSDLVTEKEKYLLKQNITLTMSQTFGKCPQIVFTTCKSVHDSSGISELISGLENSVLQMIQGSNSLQVKRSAVITRTRHRDLVESAVQSLNLAIASKHDIVLKCEETRQAAVELGRITGEIDVEEILDTLFSDFCIGK